MRSTEMKSIAANENFSGVHRLVVAGILACLWMPVVLAGQSTAKSTSPGAGAETFDSPEHAVDALIAAASPFDEAALRKIFGPAGDKIILTGEMPEDKERATDFVAEAREKKNISLDPKSGKRAFLLVGNEEWPFPVPLVKTGDRWFFDAKAGERELLYRRIGANEFDAIDLCEGFVEAQKEYAMKKRQGYDVNQYAQRVVSTPGTQDGLAWQNADGSWEGPVGKKIAEVIEQGYKRDDPYHGYFFKVLKGQGPAAHMGEMDYVIKGVMIGGFALVAAPADYRVSGVKTFIVNQDGVVYEKDLGPHTVDEFKKMERFNPDSTWKPVPQD
jgi:hypothetical protein